LDLRRKHALAILPDHEPSNVEPLNSDFFADCRENPKQFRQLRRDDGILLQSIESVNIGG
jgi:hypothetical protein